MSVLLIIWIVAGITMMLIGTRGQIGSAGLPLAYVFELSLIHVPGAILYDGYEDLQTNAVLTRIGFQETVVAIVAFSIAVVMARLTSLISQQNSQVAATATNLAALNWLSLIYMGLGLLFFMATPILSRIPSGGAIASALGSMTMVGACLRLWAARESGNRAGWWQTVIMLPVFPLIILLKDGFLSFGTHWLLSILGFMFAQSKRRRVAYIAIAPVIAFVGLSVFVNYMASRTEFRKLVWYEQADLGARIR